MKFRGLKTADNEPVTLEAETLSQFERRILSNGLRFDGDLKIDSLVIKKIRGGYRYVEDDTQLPFKERIDSEWEEVLKALMGLDSDSAQLFNNGWKHCLHKAVRDDFLFVVAQAGKSLSSVLALANKERVRPLHQRSEITQLHIAQALEGDVRGKPGNEVAPRIENPLIYKLKRLFEMRNSLVKDYPELMGVVENRLTKLLAKAEVCRSSEEALTLINEDSFKESVLLTIAIARSAEGQDPLIFEKASEDLSVQIFNGKAQNVTSNNVDSPEFSEHSEFTLAEWEMVLEHFEAAYSQYPRWKEVLKSSLLADLNNPKAKFYIIYHEDKPIAIRKMIAQDDGAVYAGTFYVNTPYQGIGNRLEQWTFDDLPAGLIVKSSAAPKNKAIEGHLERGRVITGLTSEVFEKLESETLFCLEKREPSPYLSHNLEVYPKSEVLRLCAEGVGIEQVQFSLLTNVQDLSLAISDYVMGDCVITRLYRVGDSAYALVTEAKV